MAKTALKTKNTNKTNTTLDTTYIQTKSQRYVAVFERLSFSHM